MSRAHGYHQANASDPGDEESDSEADIDLQELDPAASNHNYPSSQNLVRKNGAAEGIRLKDLRFGRNSGPGKYSRRLGLHGSDRRGDDDLQGLLQEDAASTDSPGNAADSEPLLSQDSISSERNEGVSKARAAFSSLLEPKSDEQEFARVQSPGAARNINIGQYPAPRFPPNSISNAKYTPWSFLPRTLYNEFSFFFNMYFLLVALSQIIPPLRIGYLSTYVAPLAFVLTITLGKEALDDVARRKRDNEANKEEYVVLRLRDIPQNLSKERNVRKKPFSKRSRRENVILRTTRLDAIAEEEDNVGNLDEDFHVEMDEMMIKSRDLKVGDVLRLGKDQRVPADLVILKSYITESAAAVPLIPSDNPAEHGSVFNTTQTPDFNNSPATTVMNSSVATKASASSDNAGNGETFIRTDQLDGETDWKLRLASPLTQSLDPRNFSRLKIVAGLPSKKVNEFLGTVEYHPTLTNPGPGSEFSSGGLSAKSAPLTIDNTAWANTVLASSATVLAVVVYTGAQTRQAMSTSPSRSKTGLLEHEINNLTKILCALTLTLSVVLVALEGFESHAGQKWYVAITRFLILFSTIIPISLRVNLDMGKTVYAWFVERDQDIPDTVVRTSTIPEELGRIEYLLSDKTGTLTRNGKRLLWLLCILLTGPRDGT